MFSKIASCRNISDIREIARKRLPFPIFDYIDGAADDEITLHRNTNSFNDCDLVPNVLSEISEIDMTTNIMGCKLNMPLFCSPTALQRLFHPQGEKAVAKAAERFGTMVGVSSIGTYSLKEISELTTCPKLFQLYFHKDKGINNAMIVAAKEANFDALALTVDTIALGNRERDLKSGFVIPPKLSLKSLISFASHPSWFLSFYTSKKFDLPQLKDHIKEGSDISVSLKDYFSKMIDQSISWKDAESISKRWKGHFCIKGIMSPEDAKKAIDIGADSIMVSNHGGRQLDGSRSPFDQLSEIVDTVDNKIEVILDGGIRRGTHVLKALACGASACSGGRMYLYGLAAGGQKGVEKCLSNMKNEIDRGMRLMGVKKISDLNRGMLRYR